MRAKETFDEIDETDDIELEMSGPEFEGARLAYIKAIDIDEAKALAARIAANAPLAVRQAMRLTRAAGGGLVLRSWSPSPASPPGSPSWPGSRY